MSEGSNRLRALSSGKEWQDRASFAAAVRVDFGPLIFVSGQVARDSDGVLIASKDMASQARQTFANLRDVLAAAGASPRGVIKLTYFVTDMTQWSAVAEARAEFFADYLPASTTVEVSRLFDPGALIEIDAIAVPDETM
ncbi:MAG: RidA family protein [Candidatus Dormibacteria bacterium]